MTRGYGRSIQRWAAPACGLAVVTLAAVACLAAKRTKTDRQMLRAGCRR